MMRKKKILILLVPIICLLSASVAHAQYIPSDNEGRKNVLDSMTNAATQSHAESAAFCSSSSTIKITALGNGDMAENNFRWVVYGGRITAYNGTKLVEDETAYNSNQISFLTVRGKRNIHEYYITITWQATAPTDYDGYGVAVQQTSTIGCLDNKWSYISMTKVLSASITAGPSSETVCAGASPVLSATINNADSIIWEYKLLNGAWTTADYSWISTTENGTVSTSTLTFSNIMAAYNGCEVRCIAGCGNDTSNVATITVNSAPVLTLGDVSAICKGSSSVDLPFTVISGTPSTYSIVWNSGGLTNVTDAGFPASSPITISAGAGGFVSDSYSGTLTVKSSAGCISSVYSFSFDTKDKVVITDAPDDNIICNNNTATLTAKVSYYDASGTLSYEWQYSTDNGSTWSEYISGSEIHSTETGSPNELTSTLTTAALTATTQFRLQAQNDCEAVNSTAATVQVNPATAITGQPSTTDQTNCLNVAFSSLSVTAGGVGLSYQWYSNTTNSNSSGSSISGATSSSYTPSASTTGTLYYYCIVTGTCGTVTSNVSGAHTVLPLPELSLSSGSSTQTVCINTAIVYIVYGETGTVTGVSASGLPDGVSGTYDDANHTFTISGTPSESGTFDYTVTTTGSCTNDTEIGTITVTANNTVALSSASGTNAQTVCYNSAITNITYATTGATGATFTGLPAGVIGSWNSNIVTISGTPSESGTFNYTVTLTGGCTGGTNTATGSVVVRPQFSSGEIAATGETICSGSNPVEIGSITAASGGDASISYQWQSRTAGGNYSDISGATSATYDPDVLTVTTIFRRMAKDGTCNTTFTAATGEYTVTVNNLPSVTLGDNPVICYNSNVATTASLPYTATTETPTSYSIDWTSGLTDVTDATFTSSPISITVPDGLSAGTYNGTLKVKNANGCESQNYNISVTLNAVPAISLSVKERVLCPDLGIATTLNFSYSSASENTTYTLAWSGGGITSQSGALTSTGGNLSVIVPEHTGEGTYIGTLTLNNSNSCQITETLTIVVSEVKVSVEIVDSNKKCQGESYTFRAVPINGGLNPEYQWYRNGIIVNDSTNVTFTPNDLFANEIIGVKLTTTNVDCVDDADLSMATFTWEDTTKLITQSDYGISASSYGDGLNSVEYSVLGDGAGGSNFSIVPGRIKNTGDYKKTYKNGINLYFNNSVMMDAPGVDYSVDYSRGNEAVAFLFSRKSSDSDSARYIDLKDQSYEFGHHSFVVGYTRKTGAKEYFRICYVVDDENGTTKKVTDELDLPVAKNTAEFHNYRFLYNPEDGIGKFYLDGTLKWDSKTDLNIETPGMPLYTTNSGDLTVGEALDGGASATRNGTKALDNLFLKSIWPSSADDALTLADTMFLSAPDLTVVDYDLELCAGTTQMTYNIESKSATATRYSVEWDSALLSGSEVATTSLPADNEIDVTVPSDLAAGIYTGKIVVYADSEVDCPSKNIAVKFTIHANPVPNVTGIPTGNKSLCQDNALVLSTANGMFNYVWSAGDAGDVTITQDGTHSGTFSFKWKTTGKKYITVTYTDVYGCTGTSVKDSVEVRGRATITLVSDISTKKQLVCVNGSSITPIVYLIGGSGNGAQLQSGSFPPGITGEYDSSTKEYTISGTPPNAAVDTFSFVVKTTGPYPDKEYCSSYVDADSIIVKLCGSLAVAATNTTLCPAVDTDLGFNGNDTSYNAGATAIEYTVTRIDGVGDWSFDYNLAIASGASPVYKLSTNHPASPITSLEGTVSVAAADGNTKSLVFYVINQPGKPGYTATLTISNPTGATTITTNTATATVNAMPSVGSMNQ